MKYFLKGFYTAASGEDSQQIVYPFMPNGITYPYQLDESISNFRVVGWYFSFLFKF